MAKETRKINLTYVVDDSGPNDEIDISMDTEGFNGGVEQAVQYLHIAIQAALQSEEVTD